MLFSLLNVDKLSLVKKGLPSTEIDRFNIQYLITFARLIQAFVILGQYRVVVYHF